jgi:hypothetical protein
VEGIWGRDRDGGGFGWCFEGEGFGVGKAVVVEGIDREGRGATVRERKVAGLGGEDVGSSERDRREGRD